MSDIGYSEKDFEKYIVNILASKNGYIHGNNNDYNPQKSVLADVFIDFVKSTQPENWTCLCDKFDTEKLLEDANYFEIERIYVKPYASCRHSHSAVEAAIKLHKEVDIKEIEAIEVQTYKLGVKGHDHTDIQGVASAKLSTPYAVAAGLLYGRADLSVFEPLDERIVALAQKVRVIEDPDLTAESPLKRIAIVTVRLTNGMERKARVDYAKGDPENPMTKEELAEKNNMLLAYSANHR